jgi:maleate isomerase
MESAMPPDAATDTLALLNKVHAGLRGPSHVGVLVPWGNTLVETELPRLDQVVLHYARLVPARRYRDADDFLAEIATAVPATLQQFARLTLAGTLVACTSTGFLTPEAYQDTAVVDAFDALQVLLRDLGASTIVLATPYPTRHTEIQATRLRQAGFDVAGHASLDLALLDDFTAVTSRRIADLVHSIDAAARSRADAVVLSCTAWPTIDATALLQQELGIPVVSSNLALAYSAVRFARAVEAR